MPIFTGWMGTFIKLTMKGMKRNVLWVSRSGRENMLRKVGDVVKGHTDRKRKI